MSYNPRMSIIPPGQSHNRTQRTQRSKREEAKMAMRLPDHEIVGCITDIGIPFTVADLQKPNANQVQKIFEWFAELLLNATRETVAPAMRAAARDIAGPDYGDQLFPPDSADLMGFYLSLRRLLLKCGLEDDEFNFNDLYKPTHARLVDIFSHLINFVRFRESQTNIIDEHFNRGEQVKARIQELYGENDNLEARRDEMHAHLMQSQELSAGKRKRNEGLKMKLLDLRRNQDQVAAKMEEAKIRKNQLTRQLEDKTAQKLAVKHESSKLRPYVQQSASALSASLAELSNTLASDKAYIDSLDRRARALQTSADSFTLNSTDVAHCIKLLDEIGAELLKEEDENARKSKQKDALLERRTDVQDVERAEALLQRQLAKWVERTEKLREQARAKAQEANRKMEELGEVHKKLKQERGEKGDDIEKRKVRIEQTEKKMQDLKDAIEKEVHDAHDEYLKMEAHIKLYITEMEQAIPADE